MVPGVVGTVVARGIGGVMSRITACWLSPAPDASRRFWRDDREKHAGRGAAAPTTAITGNKQ